MVGRAGGHDSPRGRLWSVGTHRRSTRDTFYPKPGTISIDAPAFLELLCVMCITWRLVPHREKWPLASSVKSHTRSTCKVGGLAIRRRALDSRERIAAGYRAGAGFVPRVVVTFIKWRGSPCASGPS